MCVFFEVGGGGGGGGPVKFNTSEPRLDGQSDFGHRQLQVQQLGHAIRGLCVDP